MIGNEDWPGGNPFHSEGKSLAVRMKKIAPATATVNSEVPDHERKGRIQMSLRWLRIHRTSSMDEWGCVSTDDPTKDQGTAVDPHSMVSKFISPLSTASGSLSLRSAMMARDQHSS